jgi:hypothetical protein
MYWPPATLIRTADGFEGTGALVGGVGDLVAPGTAGTTSIALTSGLLTLF